MYIQVFDETQRLPEGLLNVIKAVAEQVAEDEGVNALSSVDILVTDSESIREINRDKRKTDKVTDVLSFPMLKGAVNSGKPVFLGDLVICLDMVYSQAKEYCHSSEREAGFLTAHGMLHLMGYDHTEPALEKIMFDKQEEILGRLGLKRL